MIFAKCGKFPYIFQPHCLLLELWFYEFQIFVEFHMFPIVYFLSPFSLVVQNRYFRYCILKFTILSSFFFIFLLIPHIEDCVLISVIVFFSSKSSILFFISPTFIKHSISLLILSIFFIYFMCVLNYSLKHFQYDCFTIFVRLILTSLSYWCWHLLTV